MEKTAKGSGFLKVTGILMIIGGSIALLMSILAFLGIAALLASTSGVSGLVYVACIFMLVGAVCEFVAGIIGVKNCKNPEKANTCIGWGVAVAVVSVAGCILDAVSGNGFPVFSLILGLVLPVLYIMGAVKNKQA